MAESKGAVPREQQSTKKLDKGSKCLNVYFVCSGCTGQRAALELAGVGAARLVDSRWAVPRGAVVRAPTSDIDVACDFDGAPTHDSTSFATSHLAFALITSLTIPILSPA